MKGIIAFAFYRKIAINREKIGKNNNDQLTYLLFEFTFIKHRWIVPCTETIRKVVKTNEVFVKRRVGGL